MKLRFLSYRFAEEVLEGRVLRPSAQEAFAILQRLPVIPVGATPGKKAKKKRFTVDQEAMNKWLDVEFKKAGWQYHPRIIEGTKLEGDYRKDRIQLEVQFGNMARWTYDVLKFQICYSQDLIDVGVLVVPTRAFAALIGENIVQWERVCRELPHAKLSITLPIMVVGLDPTERREGA